MQMSRRCLICHFCSRGEVVSYFFFARLKFVIVAPFSVYFVNAK